MSKTIKKTMIGALAFITEHGNLSAANLETFTNDFCVAKAGGTSNGPREITILRDIEGNQLGRKCTATGKWFGNEAFSKNTTCVRAADAAKGKLYTTSKIMEKNAQTLLTEAKDITDMADKVAKYEEYDAALEAAQNIKSTFEVTDVMLEGGVDSIEELAANLNVEVNPVPQTEEA